MQKYGVYWNRRNYTSFIDHITVCRQSEVDIHSCVDNNMYSPIYKKKKKKLYNCFIIVKSCDL
jgi:hypothetical protein